MTMGVGLNLKCVCGSIKLTLAFNYDAPPSGETKFDLSDQSYKRAYYRCENCGHFTGHHHLDLSALYSGDYVDATYGGLEGMNVRLKKILGLPPEKSDNTGRVERVKDFSSKRFTTGQRVSVLDVGAGIGVFPAAVEKLGWTVTAIEPDHRTVTHLKRNVNIRAFGEDLFDLSPKQLGYFDLVTFNKVLEHVESPVELLRKSSEFLSQQGAIYVELPDIAAADDDKEREEFFIEHHHVFSPASFAVLGDKSGLSLLQLSRLREPSGKYTLAGFFVK